MRRRKNREQAPVTPEAAPVPAPEPSATADELRALREQLAQVVRQQQPEDPSPVAARRREEERWAASFIRTDSTDPCPSCGAVGGEQRSVSGSMFRRNPTWACAPCVDAMMTGYGTTRVRRYSGGETLDRLACLAAGMDSPTRTFRVLAGRYGLTFRLALDAEGGGDGTAWSHLGDLDRWRKVGALARRREAAGFGVFPATPLSALYPEMVDGRRADPTHPRGWVHAMVPKPVEPPTAEQLAAQLAAEEAAIEAELTAQGRRQDERAEGAARKAERARIDREYRAAVAAQEALFEQERRKLREDRAMVMKSASTRADFNAIVRGL